jgi:hypothetical protein
MGEIADTISDEWEATFERITEWLSVNHGWTQEDTKEHCYEVERDRATAMLGLALYTTMTYRPVYLEDMESFAATSPATFYSANPNDCKALSPSEEAELAASVQKESARVDHEAYLDSLN